MRKIGKEVLFIPTKEGNPRNGEGSMVRLPDGRIMYAYTEYYGESWWDHSIAHICACYSSDEGESWSAPSLLIEKDEDAENIMSVSLFNLQNGGVGIVYLRKSLTEKGVMACMPVFRRSSDMGVTWSEPVNCIDQLGYYCAVNDCVSVEGECIYLPFSCIPNPDLGEKQGAPKTPHLCLTLSHDGGRTWSHVATLASPYGDAYGLGEPGIYVHKDGTLWIYCRTPYGFQYYSTSSDGGYTWEPMRPQLCFTSPDAPMRVKRVGKYTVAVFDPIAYNCTSSSFEDWKSAKRTPLVCSVCENDGYSFARNGETAANGGLLPLAHRTFYIEDDQSNSYCYPAILPVADGFLVSYYHSNNTPICLNSCKITKVYYEEIK